MLNNVQTLQQQGDISRHLLRLNWLQYRRFAQQIADLNLTVPQFFTLSTLVSLGGRTTMGVLSRETHQVSATMTGIVDRLVRDDLVERDRGLDDRRAVIVSITPEGQALVEQAWGRALGLAQGSDQRPEHRATDDGLPFHRGPCHLDGRIGQSREFLGQ